jgi:6-phospho-3-hexuloisomerase
MFAIQKEGAAVKFEDSYRYILGKISESIEQVDRKKVDETLSKLLESRKIFVFGVGRSGLVAKAFAMRLIHLGLKVYVIGETITPYVEENDVVIAISGSGETSSVIRAARIVCKIRAYLISLTSNPESTLAQMSNLTIILRPISDGKKKELAPLGTLFEDAAAILLDSFVAELMARKNETEASMSARHATLE